MQPLQELIVDNDPKYFTPGHQGITLISKVSGSSGVVQMLAQWTGVFDEE
jgi:hypothetical protein